MAHTFKITLLHLDIFINKLRYIPEGATGSTVYIYKEYMINTSTLLGLHHLNKEIDGFTVSLTTYAGNKDYEAWHSHTTSSLSFLLEGAYHEDLAAKQFKRKPGNIKFIPDGVVHRCHNYSPLTKKINLEFDLQLLSDGISEKAIDGLIAAPLYTKIILLRLFNELNGADATPIASSQILIHQLFNRPPNLSNKMEPAWVVKLKQLLNDEYTSNFDLNYLSAVLGVHPVTISRYFPVYFSTSLSKYLKQLKVERALTMIKATPLSLTRIAYDCGFADQGHFTRSFKEITGCLPKYFRNI